MYNKESGYGLHTDQPRIREDWGNDNGKMLNEKKVKK